MSGTICPHCGTARPTGDAGCPCAGANAHGDTEPFAQTWVRPYLAPPRRDSPSALDGEPFPGTPVPVAPHRPGPVFGIVQAHASSWSEPDPVPEHRTTDPFAPHSPLAHGPVPPPPGPDVPGRIGPEGAAFPAEDDTLRLRPVAVQWATGEPPVTGGSPGPRRSHRKRAAARRSTDRGRLARAAGAAVVLVAVVGTTSLVGALVGTDGTVQRTAPEAPSAAVAVVTATTPPATASPPATPSTPAPTVTPVAGGAPSRAAGGGTTGTAGAASAPTPPPGRLRSTLPPSATAPEPAPSGRGSGPCTAPRLPGAPCPSTGGEPEAPGPPRAPTGLCCGASGPEVADLQYRLRWLGLYEGRVNGTYNQRLTESVTAYQRSRGITADPPGFYGRATRAALRREVPDVVSP